ncbi:hypothetical protein ACQ4PT_070781 [Festuca glaucescens]
MELRGFLLLAAFLMAWPAAHSEEARPLVPAVMVFGDSLVDVGNNDYILPVGKANAPPYGRDFKDRVATGRFCNGKLISDVIGWSLARISKFFKLKSWGLLALFPSISLPGGPEASGLNLLTGANFASGGSGYYDPTARIANVISLSEQLKYFREYHSKLAALAGDSQAQSIISGSLYIIVAGSNDLGVNYNINPLLYKTQTVDQFSDRLIGIFQNAVMRERDSAKLKEEQSAARFDDILRKENVSCVNLKSIETEKILWQEELAAERSNLCRLLENLEQAERYKYVLEKKFKEGKKMMDEAMKKVELARNEVERIKMSARRESNNVLVNAENEKKRLQSSAKEPQQRIKGLEFDLDRGRPPETCRAYGSSRATA